MTKPSKKKKSVSPADDKKTAVLLRLKPEELGRLDALAESLADSMPFASRTGLAHAAMLIGLKEIERDAAVLLPKSSR